VQQPSVRELEGKQSPQLLPRIHAGKITLFTPYGLPVHERLNRLLEGVLSPGFETIHPHFLLPHDDARFLTFKSVKTAPATEPAKA
jgi:hypothetical protein